MVRRTIISVLAALAIATAVSVAAITPLKHPSPFVRAAVLAVVSLDWPISKITNRVDMSWQGLALFADSQGCRGVSTDMKRILAFQALWSSIVYVPLFVGIGSLARKLRRHPTAR